MFWCATTRDVVDVIGPDAVTYTHSQLSQDVAALAVGERAWSFLLQPTGRVDALVGVTKLGDDHVRLDVDPGFADVVVARINRFKIRVRAEVTSMSVPCVSVRGEGTWTDLLGDAAVPPDGVREGTPDELERARLEAVWPAMGAEIVPGETIPAETGVVAVAVSFTKGCYPGQELVERMDSRGASAPRLLQRVEVPPGTSPGDVYGDGAGVVTSVQGTTALALVRRAAVS